jgi:putative phage-type endonuclease
MEGTPMSAQRTPEWFAKRAGKITGSRVNAIAAGTTSQIAKNLLATLKWERRTGVCAPTYCNDDMERGTILEAEARKEYEIDQLVVVEEVDFILHPEHDFIGISPDGLVGDDGMVEIKCPAETSAHLHQQHIDSGYYAKQYKHQINLQLACTGRQWCDVVSWYPVEGETQPLAIYRVERDEEAIDKLIKACVKAEKEISK